MVFTWEISEGTGAKLSLSGILICHVNQLIQCFVSQIVLLALQINFEFYLQLCIHLSQPYSASQFPDAELLLCDSQIKDILVLNI